METDRHFAQNLSRVIVAKIVFLALPLVLCLGKAQAAATERSAEELYTQHCAICHLPGIAGAPKVGDRADWSRRLRAGFSVMYRNAIEGVPNTAMMPNGGAPALGSGDIKAIVDHMLAAAKLSPETLAAAQAYDKLNIANRDFIRRDANFDGFLTRDEVATDGLLADSFVRFDANADGRLDVGEYERAEAVLEQERKAVRVDDGQLAAAVRKVLATVKGVDLANTKIEVANGVVSMVGIVEEPVTATQAHDGVKRIPGVQRIDNRLVSGHQMGWD
jgi:cytochrome c5